MKKNFILTVILTCVLLVFCSCEKIDTQTPKYTEGFIYTLINDGKEYELTATVNVRGDVFNIPPTYEGKPVTEVGDRAFMGTKMKKVIFPDSIRHIGESAFTMCKQLESVEIKAVYIGMGAFSDCSALKDVTIAEGMTHLSSNAFSSCTALKNITLPDTLVEIGNRAFLYCNELESIKLPFNLKALGSEAFIYCSSLGAVYIPKNLTNIGSSAFSYCSDIEKIEAEAGNRSYYSENNCLIEYASHSVAIGCKTSIIPSNEGIEGISPFAFAGCSGLREIIIPEGVKHIGKKAFTDCTSLEKVSLPSNTRYIEQWAFSSCPALTDIQLPTELKVLNRSAFDGSGNVTKENSVCYAGEWALGHSTNTAAVTVREGTKYIADYSFYSVKYIELPGTLVRIFDKAFWENAELETIKYSGTKEAWDKIKKPEYLTKNGYGYTIICSDGEIKY